MSAFANNILLAVDSAASHAIAGLLKDGSNSSQVIEAFESAVMKDKPFADFTIDYIETLHVDAGSQLISKEFTEWCESHNIELVIAAPHHQEQNARVKSVWRHL